LVINVGVSDRAARDNEAHAAEAKTHVNATKALERKAVLYEQLQRSGGEGMADNDNVLVDFEAKKLDAAEAAKRKAREPTPAARPARAASVIPGPAEHQVADLVA
jgi:hypothetical protein